MNESKLKRKSSVGKCLLYANYYSNGFGKCMLQRIRREIGSITGIANWLRARHHGKLRLTTML